MKNFVNPFEIEFPTLKYYFQTVHLEDYSDFDTFYKTLKSEEVTQTQTQTKTKNKYFR